jgi:hypothetical protein
MQEQRELHRARDEEETWLIKLINKDGWVKERRVVSYTLIGRQDLSKLLIRFLAPRDVENTGLLTWEAKEGNDDQWLYLPANRKVKRITSGNKKNRFMGTNFAFEDLRLENLALHTYTLVGSEKVDGQNCYVIDSTPATAREAADSGYSKRRLWIQKGNSYTLRREFYDKKGRVEKVETHRKLVNIKGTIWRANEQEMHDVQDGTRTVILVERRALDRGLKENFFTEVELMRGGS